MNLPEPSDSKKQPSDYRSWKKRLGTNLVHLQEMFGNKKNAPGKSSKIGGPAKNDFGIPEKVKPTKVPRIFSIVLMLILIGAAAGFWISVSQKHHYGVSWNPQQESAQLAIDRALTARKPSEVSWEIFLDVLNACGRAWDRVFSVFLRLIGFRSDRDGFLAKRFGHQTWRFYPGRGCFQLVLKAPHFNVAAPFGALRVDKQRNANGQITDMIYQYGKGGPNCEP